MPIPEHAMLVVLFCVVYAPFACVAVVLGGAAVRVVEACQKRFCGNAWDEREDSVELGEELIMEEGPESAAGSGGIEEERAGLMRGIGK